MSTGQYSTVTSSTGTGASSIINALPTLVISLVTIVGLFVLIALHGLSATAGVPPIVGLAGVHIGAAVSGSNTSGQ